MFAFMAGWGHPTLQRTMYVWLPAICLHVAALICLIALLQGSGVWSNG